MQITRGTEPITRRDVSYDGQTDRMSALLRTIIETASVHLHTDYIATGTAIMHGDDTTVSALLLGRYRVEGILGEGGIGSVVRAFDQRLRRTVAIKSLKRTLAAIEPSQLRAIEDRFGREAIAGSRMGSHPNLVAVYDLVTGPDETLYLILEYIAGGTLADRLRADGALPLADVLRLTADIARGMQAAHDVGLVHRDIKPANIFLAADGRAQVGDFGIAQIDDLSGRTQGTVGHPGTPLYMSPEQAGTSGYLSPRSDQYSLGLVVFEMLTGKAYKRLREPDANALLATHPRPVAALIERLIAENPANRYPEMANVLQETQAIATTLSFDAGKQTPSFVADTPQETIRATPPVNLLPAPPPGPPSRPQAPQESHPRRAIRRRSVLVGIGGLIVAGAAGGAYLVGRDTGGGDSGATATPKQSAGVAPTVTTGPIRIATTAPSATPLLPTATAIPRPTATPSPTATPIPLPTFSPRVTTADMRNPNEWNTISVELSSRTLANDAYTVRVLKRPNGLGLLSWGDWVPTNVKLTPQFTADVDMRLVGDPASSAGGMLFHFNNVSRAEDQQFLLFLLRGDGRFSVQQQLPGGEGHAIARIDWTASSAIKTGANAMNTPRIILRAGTLTCGVNGQQIAQLPVPAEVAAFSAFALAADIFKESTQSEASAIFRSLRYESLGVP